MSLNIQERDLITGELKRTVVAGNSNIVDTAIEIDSTWSSKKINDSLVDKAEIDDINVSITKTFSSRMIEDRYQRNARNEITTVQQIYDLDVVKLQVGLNTFWCSNLTIGNYNMLYGVIEVFRRAMDLSVIVHDTVRNIHLYCTKNNGTWGAWKELATMDKIESKYSEENILTSTDWNTLNTKARYYFSGGTPMTNSPEEVPFGLLEVINVGSYCCIQRYFAFNGKLYIRRWSGNNWNEWYRFDGISI